MYQRIKISSAQRTHGSISNFKIDLREVLEAGRYRLNEAFICNSFYNVTASNNVIYWNESAGSGNLNSTVTPGIYSASELATAVAAAMNALTTTGSVFSGSYSSSTGKMSFTSAPATPMVFTFNINTTNSISALIGFDGSEADPSAGGANQAVLNPTLSFNINIGTANEVRDAKSNGFTYVVPIDKTIGSYVLYNCKTSYDQIADLPRAMTLTVQVVDDDSTTIPLLLDWYFILERMVG